MTVVKVKFVKVYGYSLINIRLWCYSMALMNLLVTAFVTLSIDVTVEDDPKVRSYSTTRWLLVTCWFNMALIFYIHLCIYCDWQEKNGYETPQIDQLRQIRDTILTAILFPVTAFADILFWILYKLYPWIIAPPRVLDLVPHWAQHSLHTVSLAFVIMDLVLTPRRRPKNDKHNLAALYGFCFIYTLVMYVSYTRGIIVYAFFETSSPAVCVQTISGSIFVGTVLYYAQWLLVDYIWGQKSLKLGTKSLKLT